MPPKLTSSLKTSGEWKVLIPGFVLTGELSDEGVFFAGTEPHRGPSEAGQSIAGCRRVLHLDPALAGAGSVRAPSVLRDDALETELAGVLEDGKETVVDVVDRLQKDGVVITHDVLAAIQATI